MLVLLCTQLSLNIFVLKYVLNFLFLFLQVTTPFLFKLIPGLVHLGVLLRWFPLDGAVEVNDLRSVPIEI